MMIECPKCNALFRAYVEEGHLLIQVKDVYGQTQVIHSEQCRCNKKNLLPPGADKQGEGARGGLPKQ